MHAADDLSAEDEQSDVEVIRDNVEPERSDNEQQENQNENEGANDNVEDDDEQKKLVKPKRVVRNPQPKLNAQTLRGPKGLTCLDGYFKNKKYKGRGHEEEDLRVIMKTYEHWCHRLFPKYPFDDCLEKIEKLGTKKPVQTFIKQIRMNLVFDDDKPIRSDDEEPNRSGDEQQPVQSFDDPFDDLVPQQIDNFAQQQEDIALTEEQLKRITMNKEKADRLRKERLERAKERAQSLTSAFGSGSATFSQSTEVQSIGNNESRNGEIGDGETGDRAPFSNTENEIHVNLEFDDGEPMRSGGDEPIQRNDEQRPVGTLDEQFDKLAPQQENLALTEEQLERIRINKEKADRLRKDRLGRAKERVQLTSAFASNTTTLSQNDENIHKGSDELVNDVSHNAHNVDETSDNSVAEDDMSVHGASAKDVNRDVNLSDKNSQTNSMNQNDKNTEVRTENDDSMEKAAGNFQSNEDSDLAIKDSASQSAESCSENHSPTRDKAVEHQCDENIDGFNDTVNRNDTTNCEDNVIPIDCD